jgi:hypothetical protein
MELSISPGCVAGFAMNDEQPSTVVADRKKPTSLWLLIPIGMLLIFVGGVAFCVIFAIAGIIDGLTEASRALLLMVYLLSRFPAAVLAQTRNR